MSPSLVVTWQLQIEEEESIILSKSDYNREKLDYHANFTIAWATNSPRFEFEAVKVL